MIYTFFLPETVTVIRLIITIIFLNVEDCRSFGLERAFRKLRLLTVIQ